MDPSRTTALPAVEVTAGLIFREGRLLLAQRPEGTHLAGMWEFPGGKREPDETWEECLRRELREELGVEIEVGDCLFEQAHDYPTRRVLLRFFHCRILAGQPTGLDGQRLAWVTALEMADYTFPPADAELVRRLRSEPEMWE